MGAAGRSHFAYHGGHVMIMDQQRQLMDENRANWDSRVPIHLASEYYDIDGWLATNRGPRSWEQSALGMVKGLRLLHLQCHIGTDTLAWARAGAEVVGLDFSPQAVGAAKSLAQKAGLLAEMRAENGPATDEEEAWAS